MRGIVLSGMLMALFAIIGVQSAWAVAPANSTITNTASLSYTGLVTPITASVDVTVLLVATAPTVIAPLATTVAEGQVGTLTYQLRANANGPDAYIFNAPISVATTVTGSSAPTTPVNITLGATAAAAAAAIGATTLTVPVDLNPADNIVNAIAAADKLVIGASVYTVVSVVENAATGLATITLATALTTAVPIGTQIGEQQNFTVSITAGTVTAPATAGSEVITVIAKDSTGVLSSIAVSGTVNVVKVTYVKSVSVNGAAFVTVKPNVKSTDVLTYRLLVQVPANSTLNGVTFSDTVPVFMTYVVNSTTLDVDGPAGVTAPAPVADVAGASALAAGLSVNSLGQIAGVIAGGAAGVVVSVDFKVTVD